jgi:hypothetical protein
MAKYPNIRLGISEQKYLDEVLYWLDRYKEEDLQVKLDVQFHSGLIGLSPSESGLKEQK